MRVYVVIYSNFDEPCVFKHHKTAYDFMVEIITEDMRGQGYNDQEVMETLLELQRTYNNDKYFFGINRTDINICSYECEIT